MTPEQLQEYVEAVCNCKGWLESDECREWKYEQGDWFLHRPSNIFDILTARDLAFMNSFWSREDFIPIPTESQVLDYICLIRWGFT